MSDRRGSTFVLTFDFDAEEVWIGEDPGNARRPGVLSQGTYGAKVGVGLLLDLLARKDMLATFFVPGKVAERHSDKVRAIQDAGHEVAVHGYSHRSPSSLTADEEKRELEMALTVLRRLGAEPVGYRSPSWDFSERTLELLADAGIAYSSNMMDDIRPYMHHEWGIVELPVQWILDDAAHFWFDGTASWVKKIATPADVLAIWTAEFLGIHALGGLTVLTLHPQIVGRPGRLRMLEDFLDRVLAEPGVRVALAREVAEEFRNASCAERERD
jgi:peptidoglycan-N-acetylglucosamine deacetylase